MRNASFILMAIAATVAGCTKNTVDVLGTKCEQVDIGSGEVLVKCPVTDALNEIRSHVPTVKISAAGMPDAIKSDSEHIYVYILKDDCGEQGISYRFFVNELDSDEPYFVDYCPEFNVYRDEVSVQQ